MNKLYARNSFAGQAHQVYAMSINFELFTLIVLKNMNFTGAELPNESCFCFPKPILATQQRDEEQFQCIQINVISAFIPA